MRFLEIINENYNQLNKAVQDVVDSEPKLTKWFTQYQPRKTKFYDLQFQNPAQAFEYLVKNNLLTVSDKRKDTNYWIKLIKQDPENAFELGSFVLTQLENLHEKRKQKFESKSYDVLYNDGNVIVYDPLTHEASKKLGFNTTWCTASKCSDKFFNDYSEDGDLYYIHIKNEKSPNNKFAVFIMSDEPEIKNAVQDDFTDEEFAEILTNAGAEYQKVFKSMRLRTPRISKPAKDNSHKEELPSYELDDVTDDDLMIWQEIEEPDFGKKS